MCGIFATAGENPGLTSAVTKRMLDTLCKRGPDGQGVLPMDGATLAQTRLAIIDIAGGTQPMHDSERDIAITFNGEIYNYRELREELEKLGHRFVTSSDTEVILKSYLQYGEDCPKKLDGQFAFAIWDNEAKKMFLARDRFGKKPLYYAFDGDTLLLASEAKTLLASGRVKGEIDKESIDQFLALMYVPSWRSAYTDIHLLPPAHQATYQDGKFAASRYWKLEYSPLSISYDDAKEEVRRLLTEAVKKRMLAADVEVGSFLSGGVDSTFVTYLAQQFLDHPIKTFALGYGSHINELPFAQEAAEKIGSEHYTLQASDQNTDDLTEVLAYFDEPHADSSDFPQHLLSKLAASKVKVALSGDGADELFMGYGWYTKHMHIPFAQRMLHKVTSNPFKERLKNSTVFQKKERDALWGSPTSFGEDWLVQDAYDPRLGAIGKINTFDLTTYLSGQLLSKVDRTGMMHSLEVRSPFLDTALAEFAYNLPTEYKMNKHEYKIILKDLLCEIMPKEFVYRRKQGFGAPVKKWMTEPQMRQFIEKTLGGGARVHTYLQKKEVDRLVESFYSGNNQSVFYQVWVLMCLELWLQAH